MHLVSIAIVAGFIALTGARLDKVSRQRRQRIARTRWQQETAALEVEIDQAEKLRHESELRSGEFDLLG